MQATLENIRKTTIKSLRSVLKRKNKVKEGGTLGLGVKKQYDNIEARA
jgi:hypothetical protein